MSCLENSGMYRSSILAGITFCKRKTEGIYQLYSLRDGDVPAGVLYDKFFYGGIWSKYTGYCSGDYTGLRRSFKIPAVSSLAVYL